MASDIGAAKRAGHGHILMSMAVLVASLALYFGGWAPFSTGDFGTTSASVKEVVQALSDHSLTFEKREVLRIADSNVFLAIGYGLANSAMVVGEDGVVIIDCMESVEAAQDVVAAFAESVPRGGQTLLRLGRAVAKLGCAVAAPPYFLTELWLRWVRATLTLLLTLRRAESLTYR